jgi:copper(I)-binding protein
MRQGRQLSELAASLVLLLLLPACDEAQLVYESHTMGSNGDAYPVELRNVLVRPPESGLYQVGENAIVQFTMVNEAEVPDALVGVGSGWAADVELFWDRRCDGAAESVSSIPLPATGPVVAQDALHPGAAYYLVLVDLTETVQQGTSVPITFTFDRAGSETMEAIVLAERAGLGLPPLGCIGD